MKMKTLIAVAVAGAFAVPFAAQASVENDRIVVAQAGGGGAGGGSAGAPGGASSGPGSSSTGAAAQGGASTDAPSTSTGAAGGTSAQSTGAPGTGPTLPPTDLQQLDANNDGYVSREEAAKNERLNTRFSELDKDSDGRISRSEWDAAMSATGGASTGAGSTGPAQSTGTAASRPQK